MTTISNYEQQEKEAQKLHEESIEKFFDEIKKIANGNGLTVHKEFGDYGAGQLQLIFIQQENKFHNMFLIRVNKNATIDLDIHVNTWKGVSMSREDIISQMAFRNIPTGMFTEIEKEIVKFFTKNENGVSQQEFLFIALKAFAHKGRSMDL